MILKILIVLSSYYREGIPMTLMEATTMEMPLITTDNVGCREVVEDGYNGFMVPVRDIEELSSAMETFILKPDLIAEMGKNLGL
jgi:glycosyltransferase involved in cell wall biosynthesis